MAYRIDRPGHPGAELCRIATEQLARAVAELRGEDLDTGVHEARRCSKKLRSLLRLVRDPLGPVHRDLNARIRDAARELSDLRDATVLVATCEAMAERHAERAGEAFRQAGAVLRERRGAVVEAQEAQERVARVADTLVGLATAIDGWPGAETLTGAHLFAGLRVTYGRGRKAMKQARRGGAEELHDWRKRTKDLGYQLRLLQGCWKPVLKVSISELDRLADLLGEYHDLVVLQGTLRDAVPPELGDADAVATMLELLGDRACALLDRARPLGQRLWSDRPRAFAARLEDWWQTWRDHRR